MQINRVSSSAVIFCGSPEVKSKLKNKLKIKTPAKQRSRYGQHAAFFIQKSCSLCAPSSDSISASGCVLNKICRFFDALKCGAWHTTIEPDIKIPAVVIAVKGGCWGAVAISSIGNTLHCAVHLQLFHQLIGSIDRGKAWSIFLLISQAEDLHLGVISQALQCCGDY